MELTAPQLLDRLQLYRRHEYIVEKTEEVRDLLNEVESFLTLDPRQFKLVDGLTITVEICIEWLEQLSEDDDFDEAVRKQIGDEKHDVLLETGEWQDLNLALMDTLTQHYLLNQQQRNDLSEEMCNWVRLDSEWDELHGEFNLWILAKLSDLSSDTGFWLEVMARYKLDQTKRQNSASPLYVSLAVTGS